VDGRIVPVDAPALRPDDGAFTQGLGCYTSARTESGRLRHGRRSARRLARDAARLGLGAVDEEACLGAMSELAEACFGADPGIVRAQASADGDGGLHLVVTARGPGADRKIWRARTSSFHHEGPGPTAGIKLSGHPVFAWERRELARESLDEALFFDSEGRLVEGTRSNLVVCGADGVARTPPLARGGVAGVAREIAIERLDALRQEDVGAEQLATASEIVALNSVRGARPIVELGGSRVGEGAPGPWARRLREALDAEE